MSRSEWAVGFTARAAAYWTPERLSALLDGKSLLLTPANAPTLLRAIGLLHRDATMPPREVRKFFQLNHMLRLLDAPIKELRGRGTPICIVDAGCGLAYLTTALAWTFAHVYRQPAYILGIDKNEAATRESTRRAAQLELQDGLAFEAAALADVDLDGVLCRRFPPPGRGGRRSSTSPRRVDVVLGLHACDVATDDAIVLGVRARAKVIAVAPCCQAELARGWRAGGGRGPFEAIHTTPHLCREVAASVTDTLRVLLLRASGYQASAVEFVSSRHTPKNTLIRAVHAEATRPAAEGWRAYHALCAATGGVGIGLADRLQDLPDLALNPGPADASS